MADKSYISKIQLPSGSEPYWIKDSEARTQINALSNIVSGALVVCGETTTALSNGATTNPVAVKYAVTIRGVEYAAGQNYNAVAGDVFFYNNKEFVFDGTNWIEFGDITGLGNLAFSDQTSASYTPSGTLSAKFAGDDLTSTGNYTPQGEVSAKFAGDDLTSTGNYTPSGTIAAPVISLASGGDTTIVKNLSVDSVVQSATQGTLPTLGMTVGGSEGETLSISWGAGTLPTFTSTYTNNVTALSSVPSYTASAPAFTGTSAVINVTGTPTGSITDTQFMGSQASLSVTGTPSGSITDTQFMGTSGTITSNPVPKS